jgi:hypothetical protein
MIRVGRRLYSRNGSFCDPKCSGFEPVLCLTKSSPYGKLSPYVLRNERGVILENLWQFSKVYQQVPRTIQHYSRYDQRVIWDHPAEVHFANEEETEAFWNWREKGLASDYPIRYPVGFQHRSKCLHSLVETETVTKPEEVEVHYERVGYIEARCRIYIPEYLRAVRREEQFGVLRRKLRTGTNLLIIEVDGPHQESLQYYRDKYHVDETFIVDHTVLATRQNLSILLHDALHPYGHGYCLAEALMS